MAAEPTGNNGNNGKGMTNKCTAMLLLTLRTTVVMSSMKKELFTGTTPAGMCCKAC